MLVLATSIANMKHIIFLMNIHRKNSESMYDFSMKYFIVHVVFHLLQHKRVHTMKITESIFLEREFVSYFVMVSYRQKRLLGLGRRRRRCQVLSERGRMRSMNRCARWGTQMRVCSLS